MQATSDRPDVADSDLGDLDDIGDLGDLDDLGGAALDHGSGIAALAADMPVGQLIGDTVEWIPGDATLSDAARRLTKDAIGALLVGEPDGSGHGTRTAQVDGIVTERDLVHAMAEGLDPATTRLSQLASTDLVWCDVDATVAEVGAEMMDHYVRHVLVEDRGRLAGIVSVRDLAGVLTATVE